MAGAGRSRRCPLAILPWAVVAAHTTTLELRATTPHKSTPARRDTLVLIPLLYCNITSAAECCTMKTINDRSSVQRHPKEERRGERRNETERKTPRPRR